MTNSIPQAAIDAAAERFDAGPGFDVSILARYALEAAMPHLRAQIEQLQARLAAVEELHYPALMPKPRGGALKVCTHCAMQMHAVEKRAVWPCDTIKAVRGE